MSEQRTPEQMFEQLMSAAQGRATQEQNQEREKSQAAAMQVLTQIAETVKQAKATTDQLVNRVQAIESGRQPVVPQNTPPDPYAPLKEWGLDREQIAPAVRHEVAGAVEQAVDKLLGPALRESQAFQSHMEKNKDFDQVEFNRYLASNPEVATVYREAASKGAFTAGIQYVETRRDLDAKIHQQAEGEVGASRRKKHIADSRPDAQVVGASGAGGNSRHVGNPLTQKQLEEIYANANAGNWKPFEDKIVSPNLPSEEWFQRLAQS